MKAFYERKGIWKCRLQNVRHFVQASALSYEYLPLFAFPLGFPRWPVHSARDLGTQHIWVGNGNHDDDTTSLLRTWHASVWHVAPAYRSRGHWYVGISPCWNNKISVDRRRAFLRKNISKGIFFNKKFRIWFLIGWQHSCEPTKILFLKILVNQQLYQHGMFPVRWAQERLGYYIYGKHMMTSSNGNILRVTGHLCGEFTGPRWIPRTKASGVELWCFLWSASE